MEEHVNFRDILFVEIMFKFANKKNGGIYLKKLTE